MTTRLQALWHSLSNRGESHARDQTRLASERPRTARRNPIDIDADDPILPVLQRANGVVDVESLELESPTLSAMRAADVKLVVPLVSQGELIGVITLGPRLSDQEYSGDDRRLLSNLAIQAAPAVRVAQLARQQQIEARERERIEQELRVARVIQQTLLPHETPRLPGWAITAYYRPARAVGGDFYDFYYFDDGCVGFSIGDVTDKGVPAALVMATTRAILRGAASRGFSPGEILERANELLHPDMPPKMFVTCFFCILDPATGSLRFANAGHDVPYRRTSTTVKELRARGMPLGLLPGMHYEEFEATLSPGESVLFYSDGLVEAHNTDGEMFGFPRTRELLAAHDRHDDLITYLMTELGAFTGENWEQEDDVTLMTLTHLAMAGSEPLTVDDHDRREQPATWEPRLAFQVASVAGNERIVTQRVAESAIAAGLPARTVSRLKTAVAEAAMNAIEHGNRNQHDLPVDVSVLESETGLMVRVTDQGTFSGDIRPDAPSIEAKLAGEQSLRGWGLFLMQNMADVVHLTGDEHHYTIELIFHRPT